MTDVQAKATALDLGQDTKISIGMQDYATYGNMQALLHLTDEIDYDTFEHKYEGFTVGEIIDGTAKPKANLKYLRTSIKNLKSRFNHELDEILGGVRI